MKMAKATERDIDAAGELIQVLDAIDTRFGGPWPLPDVPEDLPKFLDGEAFDSDDTQHLKTLYNHLARLLRSTANFHGRVIGGMCYVILYPKNEILDPTADTLELHPRLQDALKDEARLLLLLRNLPGDALRAVVGELPDMADLAAFRSAADLAIESTEAAGHD